jgi:Ran GTPase-activating protein (RanGAP) involved in mRNA processing and transport
MQMDGQAPPCLKDDEAEEILQEVAPSSLGYLRLTYEPLGGLSKAYKEKLAELFETNCDGIKKLHLDGCFLDNASFSIFLPALQLMSDLEVLALDNNKLCDKSCIALAEASPSWPKLTTLTFENNTQMTDSGIQDLVQALTQNTKFEAS